MTLRFFFYNTYRTNLPVSFDLGEIMVNASVQEIWICKIPKLVTCTKTRVNKWMQLVVNAFVVY